MTDLWKSPDRMMFRPLCVFATLLIVLSSQAAAETTYPTKPVRIVVPFAPGGIADITTRVAADKLSQKFGQRFFVENQPGAGGITAARTVISARLYADLVDQRHCGQRILVQQAAV